MATTSTGWLDEELQAGWAKRPDSRGVIVLVEEAQKDFEVNKLGVLVNVPWHTQIKAVILSGDIKRPGPMGSDWPGSSRTNQFSGSLDKILFSRLVYCGFPTHVLTE